MHVGEEAVQPSSLRLRCQCLQGLLTADPTLADGFRRTRFLVLDEADRLLEPTFQVCHIFLCFICFA